MIELDTDKTQEAQQLLLAKKNYQRPPSAPISKGFPFFYRKPCAQPQYIEPVNAKWLWLPQGPGVSWSQRLPTLFNFLLSFLTNRQCFLNTSVEVSTSKWHDFKRGMYQNRMGTATSSVIHGFTVKWAVLSFQPRYDNASEGDFYS